MRILVLNWKDLSHPDAGGAEVYTHEIARRWVRWGHEVTQFSAATAATAMTAPSTGAAAHARDGVRIVRGGGRHTVYRAARRWYRDCGAGAFDVVIDQVNTRPFMAPRFVDDCAVVALIHQVAREIWFHETGPLLAPLGRYVLEPVWLRRFRDVPTMTVSPSSAASLHAYGLRDVHLVPEGCDAAPRPAVAKERRPTLCMVGRLTSSKRPFDALAAFAEVRRRHPDAQLWFVGDGPLRTRIEAERVPGVRCWGRVDHARKFDLMARAHVLVATSVREGWGLVVDEAAAVATPTVAYDVAGLRDSVPAARGVVTAPSPRALATAVTDRLPGWMAAPASHGWRGGAVDWDTVAKEVLRCVEAAQ